MRKKTSGREYQNEGRPRNDPIPYSQGKLRTNDEKRQSLYDGVKNQTAINMAINDGHPLLQIKFNAKRQET